MPNISFKKGWHIVCHLEWNGERRRFVRGVAESDGVTGTAALHPVRFRNRVLMIPGNQIYLVSENPILAAPNTST